MNRAGILVICIFLGSVVFAQDTPFTMKVDVEVVTVDVTVSDENGIVLA